MRDYLLPAKSYLNRAKVRAQLLPKASIKPTIVTVLASTAIIAFIASGVVALRTAAANGLTQSNDAVIQETVTSPGVSVTTQSNSTTTDQPTSSETTVQTESSSTSNSEQTNGAASTSTSVTVNNEPIAVPQNGSVQKDIQTDSGTTHVNVSVNNSGSGSNSSSSTTQLFTNTNTVSQNVIVSSP